ncbi:MAG: hypothetical protein QOJ16_2278 [Acidobacteriota bacterium]|nr:hypothetical protein [Acidobacteriota bacterium]
MRPIPVPFLKSLSSLLLVLLVASPATSATASPAAESRQPAVFRAESQVQLELASGERVAPRLPAGAELANAAALGDHGWVVTALDKREIVVRMNEGSRGAVAATLPALPDVFGGSLRREPLPLVEDGHLGGLVWLEGDGPRGLGVRFARWNGTGWEAPRTVAAPGPGSQLALTAARLADGPWLLAWSAFDGHDDEIVWSRQAADGTWSAPRRVAADNSVPDVTPALTATAGGALLAWSRFDGTGYQVVTSRFRAGKWEEPRAAAPSGSLFPAFQPASSSGTGAGTAAYLLYQTAAPRGWAAVEVDGSGQTGAIAKIAKVATASHDQPVVEASPDRSGVTFRWPGTGEERAASWVRP